MTQARTHVGPRGEGRQPRAFTIFEMLLVLIVIFIMVGLLMVSVHHFTKSSKSTADRAEVNSLQQAAAQFKQQFKFNVPIVKDMGDPPAFAGTQPPVSGGKPRVYSLSDPNDLAALRTPTAPAAPDMRFSIYSIAYYLLGALDAPVDGVAGPGFRGVRRDGSFETAGAVFKPFFDVGRRANAVYQIDAPNGRIVLRDRNEVAYRLYHWEHNATVATLADLNVPVIVGDPAVDERLKTATYAIVAAGPDGLFGNEEQLPTNHPQYVKDTDVRARLGLPSTAAFNVVWDKASKDNIVEVLQP